MIEKQIAIIGAGGFSREIQAHMGKKVICFVDDQYWKEDDGWILKLSDFDPKKYKVLIAVGNPKQRASIAESLPTETEYFTFIHRSAQILDGNNKIGEGSVICANVIITTNVTLGKHTHLNLSSTVGHDTVIGDFFTTAPGAKISGNCNIGNRVYFGTNASVREKISICDDATIGLNAGVVKDIKESGTYVGLPARKLSIT